MSRLLCSAEYPTCAEMRQFLDHGSPHRALRQDAGAQPHALGDDAAAEAACDGAGHRPSRAARKDRRQRGCAARAHRRFSNCWRSRRRAGRGRPAGIRDAARRKIRPRGVVPRRRPRVLDRPAVEKPGSRPLDFEDGGSLGAKLVEWPIAHTIKCLCFYHPDDFQRDESATGARSPQAVRRPSSISSPAPPPSSSPCRRTTCSRAPPAASSGWA